MDLWVREARIFKYGSGTGTNFSDLRGEGEPLSGGGKSSGLMSFLKIGDRAAGAIKSGGTTRRAAKMVFLDLDHPDIEEFINWKVDRGAEGRRAGGRLARPAQQAPERVICAMPWRVMAEEHVRSSERTWSCARPWTARKALVPEILHRTALCNWPEQGVRTFELRGVRHRLGQSKAYYTVSGQNSNNSVRITNEFMRRCETRLEWDLHRRRTEGKSQPRPCKAHRDLWDQIADAAWSAPTPVCSSTRPSTSGTPVRPTAAINATNPCSEYMFLDDTACNLASLNLLKFFERQDDRSEFDIEAFRHADRLWTIVLEISVLHGSVPVSRRSRGSRIDYRTLGLGYANLGALLMVQGIPYDSDRGRA